MCVLGDGSDALGDRNFGGSCCDDDVETTSERSRDSGNGNGSEGSCNGTAAVCGIDDGGSDVTFCAEEPSCGERGRSTYHFDPGTAFSYVFGCPGKQSGRAIGCNFLDALERYYRGRFFLMFSDVWALYSSVETGFALFDAFWRKDLTCTDSNGWGL